MEPQEIRWLWKKRIAAGKVTLLAGDPGHGKSTVTRSITAAVTRGWPWPDGEPGCEPGNVIILAAEDGLRDTLVPRLLETDADMSRVYAIQGVEFGNEDKTKQVFNLKYDTPKLVEAMRNIGHVPLVIIDPISSYMDGVDSHKNGEVRSALQPLVEAAEECGTAVLLVTHLSKAQARSALSAATGSLAFGALARQAHLVIPDAGDPTGDRRLFLCMKSNICRKPAGLAFEIGDGGIHWLEGAVHVDPDEALRKASGGGDRRGAKTDAASHWLKTLGLDKGPMAASRVQALAEEEGFTYATLNRAFKSLGGITKRDGFGGSVTWRLPDLSEIENDHSHTFQEWNDAKYGNP